MSITSKQNIGLNIRAECGRLINVVQHNEISHILFVMTGLLVCLYDGICDITQLRKFVSNPGEAEVSKNQNIVQSVFC